MSSATSDAGASAVSNPSDWDAWSSDAGASVVSSTSDWDAMSSDAGASEVSKRSDWDAMSSEPCPSEVFGTKDDAGGSGVLATTAAGASGSFDAVAADWPLSWEGRRYLAPCRSIWNPNALAHHAA